MAFSANSVFLEGDWYKICTLESISLPNLTNNSLFERGENSPQSVISFFKKTTVLKKISGVKTQVAYKSKKNGTLLVNLKYIKNEKR